MQDNSLCKCKSFVHRTAKEWPKVFVVSLHQFLNGGRQNLIRVGDGAIHDPVKAVEDKTHTHYALRYLKSQCRKTEKQCYFHRVKACFDHVDVIANNIRPRFENTVYF